MTLEEALAELDVGGDAEKAEIRKAYLRLLKTRKPEVDAAGFMRLREAYEILCGWLAVRPLIGEARVAAPAPLEAQGAGSATAEPSSRESRSDVTAASRETPTGPPAVSETASPPPIVDGMALVNELGVDGAARRASCALQEALDNPGVPLRAAPVALLELMLLIHELSDGDCGAELLRLFKSWLDLTGVEARVMAGGAIVWWSVVRQLDAIRQVTPWAVRGPGDGRATRGARRIRSAPAPARVPQSRGGAVEPARDDEARAGSRAAARPRPHAAAAATAADAEVPPAPDHGCHLPRLWRRGLPEARRGVSRSLSGGHAEPHLAG
jgi:hypothetical protein